ncbi:MAG: hypothetical protein N2441_06910 [Rhodocyclaceae bacterium]|nr:hypothetical protein [Rhodocyclaceae bacterium]
MKRRIFCGAAALFPWAMFLPACGRQEEWPEGMQPIKWDRDTCVTCGMAISDRRFAGEMRGGPKNIVFKFDDPGCIALWIDAKAKDYPWIVDPATKIWVADVASEAKNVRWIDARTARYVRKFSPMGYNFGAVSASEEASIDFATMCQEVVAIVRKRKPA